MLAVPFPSPSARGAQRRRYDHAPPPIRLDGTSRGSCGHGRRFEACRERVSLRKRCVPDLRLQPVGRMQSRRAYPSMSAMKNGLWSPLPDLTSRNGRSARAQSAGGVQRAALRGAIRRGLACDAPRSAALARGERSSPTLAEGWAASRPWSTTCAPCCAWLRAGPRNLRPWSSTAGRCARRPRVGPAPLGTAISAPGIETARGRRYARAGAGVARHARQCRRPRRPWRGWLMPCRRRPATA